MNADSGEYVAIFSPCCSSVIAWVFGTRKEAGCGGRSSSVVATACCLVFASLNPALLSGRAVTL